MYANEVYLGQRGSFAIHGFAEGATAQFGKDLSALTLPEAATLAGIIPAPNAYSRASIRSRHQRAKFDSKSDAQDGCDYDGELRKVDTAEMQLTKLTPTSRRTLPCRFHS
jgi:penicillin-binding protein 1B